MRCVTDRTDTDIAPTDGSRLEEKAAIMMQLRVLDHFVRIHRILYHGVLHTLPECRHPTRKLNTGDSGDPVERTSDGLVLFLLALDDERTGHAEVCK